MAADLVPSDDPDAVESVGLTGTQVRALENLHKLGAAPRASVDEKYSKDPQIRALQMVFEGKFGGGPQRRNRNERISVGLTQYVRGHLSKKVQKALDRALKSDAGERINLDAIKLIVDMEHKEAKLQLSEDQADLENKSKEELLATLFDLVQEAQTASVINATFRDIPTQPPTDERLLALDQKEQQKQRRESARVATQRARRRASTAESSERNGDSPDATGNGVDAGRTGADGRGVSAQDRQQRPSPLSEATLRRAADRRRASRVGKAEPPR